MLALRPRRSKEAADLPVSRMRLAWVADVVVDRISEM